MPGRDRIREGPKRPFGLRLRPTGSETTLSPNGNPRQSTNPHHHMHPVNWRALGVLLLATACLALEGAIRSGQLPDVLPWPTIYVPQSVLVAYFIVPFAVLPLLGHNPVRYFGLGQVRQVWGLFVVSLAIILASAVWLASLASVRTYYFPTPGSTAFLIQTALTVACVEFFFRGVLLLPLFAELGWYALPVATMPYCLIHQGKPVIELFGSIVFGLGLSYLAVRSGSILYGLALHWLLAVGLRSLIALSQ